MSEQSTKARKTFEEICRRVLEKVSGVGFEVWEYHGTHFEIRFYNTHRDYSHQIQLGLETLAQLYAELKSSSYMVDVSIRARNDSLIILIEVL